MYCSKASAGALYGNSGGLGFLSVVLVLLGLFLSGILYGVLQGVAPDSLLVLRFGVWGFLRVFEGFGMIL